MPPKTVSSRQFNQDSSGAKKAANDGPVFITDRGKPSHVLLTIAEYERLVGDGASIIDLLAMSASDDIELEVPKLGALSRPAELN